MSTNVYVKFYVNDKNVGKAVCIDKLKSMLSGWYWGDELVPIFNLNIADAGDYWYEDFLAYVLLKDLPRELKDRVVNKNEKLILKLEEGEEIANYLSVQVSTEEIKSPDFHTKYVQVFGWKKETYKGSWFDENSFYNARIENEVKLKEFKEKHQKLLSIKNSVEFYKLEEEQKNCLVEDIEFQQDIIEEYEMKVYICQFMIDALEMMADMYGETYSDKCICFIYLG